jgi:hypothetical protein
LERSLPGYIVIFDVLGAAPRGSGATEAAARDAVRRVAETLKIPCNKKDFDLAQSRLEPRPFVCSSQLLPEIGDARCGIVEPCDRAPNTSSELG